MIINKTYQTVDMHVEGEPLRIIVDGLPEIKGDTQLERRAYAMKNLDHIRKVLMYEPRGHHGMYGCIITPSAKKDSDFGVLFLHNEGWSTMCGHGIIAVVTMGVETGRFSVEEGFNKFVIDSPAGEVIAFAEIKGNRVESVAFENVPSFVLHKDIQIEVEGKHLTVDVSFGGAFYVILESRQLDLEVNKRDLPELQKWATKIKRKVEEDWEITHPLEERLTGIYGVVYSDKPNKADSDLKNVTIFADEQIDRSPCGTATAARLASLYTHGELDRDEKFVHESITNGQFIGKIKGTQQVSEYTAVNTWISGKAFITGFHQFVTDPKDTLPEGFLLEEI